MSVPLHSAPPASPFALAVAAALLHNRHIIILRFPLTPRPNYPQLTKLPSGAIRGQDGCDRRASLPKNKWENPASPRDRRATSKENISIPTSSPLAQQETILGKLPASPRASR
ncbi:hypothetical protein EJ05DRAFT_479374 [Pseudovirgaria hyperparasitica]|uniref:Uncharacterized protein n=1 Tax=Pseudovirgaria hyperparasitica TaxID=470096 RepID=A0A6A6VXF7_9PEZI|nr:uncharacterized protein EJ05DRAFT_479374 [Pseudovirgaria hyperparasitica]KAF2754384.1 hypothetical protein EJ05DRAFT_479374 [Pseudovirgaria hyperparasitica]